MVDFNPGEIRGFHGRWILGGARHAHLRRSLRAAGSGRESSAAESAEKAGASERRFSEAEVKKSAETVARSQGVSNQAVRSALHDYGMGGPSRGGGRGPSRGGGRGMTAAEHEARQTRMDAARAAAENRRASEKSKRDAEKAKNDKKAASRNRRRGAGRGLRGIRGGRGRGLGNVLALARLASLLKGKKAAAAKKPAAKKKPVAKKKAPPKKPAVRKPTVIKPPKAPVGKQVAGRARATTVKPSAQVMANLAKYVATP